MSGAGAWDSTRESLSSPRNPDVWARPENQNPVLHGPWLPYGIGFIVSGACSAPEATTPAGLLALRACVGCVRGGYFAAVAAACVPMRIP